MTISGEGKSFVALVVSVLFYVDGLSARFTELKAALPKYLLDERFLNHRGDLRNSLRSEGNLSH